MLYTIIAGVNGCGKSSFSGASSAFADFGKLIDADKMIAEKQSAFYGIKAAVLEIERCLENRIDFTQETTLSRMKTLRTIKKARNLGYDIRMYYIAVSSAEESVKRIKNRVEKGGHNIPDEVVKRRFESCFTDLLKVLRYCDTADFFDNENGFVKVGEYSNGKISNFGDEPQWFSKLVEMENEW